MFFQKKNDDVDLESLKKAIESKKNDVRKEQQQDYGYTEERRPYTEERRPRPQKQPQDDSAPLFVKVSKYNEILSNLQEMKAYIAGVKQLYRLLSEIETTREESLKLLRSTLQKVERNIVQLDSGLLRPMGTPVGQKSEQSRHVEESLSDLESQLESLKSELEKFK
jgi:hypothetical protein